MLIKKCLVFLSVSQWPRDIIKGQWSRDIIMTIVTVVRPLFVLCNSLSQVPLCDFPVTAVSMPTVFPFGETFWQLVVPLPSRLQVVVTGSQRATLCLKKLLPLRASFSSSQITTRSLANMSGILCMLCTGDIWGKARIQNNTDEHPHPSESACERVCVQI